MKKQFEQYKKLYITILYNAYFVNNIYLYSSL